MAHQLKYLMGLGFGALTAEHISGTVADNLTATGTTQADALQLTEDNNVVPVVIAGSGVRLPPVPAPGDEILVANLGANAVNIYPSSGGNIQNGAANAPFNLPAGAVATFTARAGSSNWIVAATAGMSGTVTTLGTLTFSATSFTIGSTFDGTISGATSASTITATGLPSSITINSAARTFHYDGTGTASSGSFTLFEALTGAANTPNPSIISYSIAAASGSLTTSAAPTLSGDDLVGQWKYATSGTYSPTPDSITWQWFLDGNLLSDQVEASVLQLDAWAGSVLSYTETATKTGYTSAVNTVSGGTIASISLTNAITSLTRTSTSGMIPMTADIAFASNVYEGY